MYCITMKGSGSLAMTTVPLLKPHRLVVVDGTITVETDDDYESVGTYFQPGSPRTLSTNEAIELDLRNDYYFPSPPPDITDEEKRAGIFKIIMSEMAEKYSETYLLRDPYADLPPLYELLWEPPPCRYSY